VFVENAFSPDNLGPDLVVVDHRTRHVAVIDVTIPYEADPVWRGGGLATAPPPFGGLYTLLCVSNEDFRAVL